MPPPRPTRPLNSLLHFSLNTHFAVVVILLNIVSLLKEEEEINSLSIYTTSFDLRQVLEKQNINIFSHSYFFLFALNYLTSKVS